MYVRLAVKWVGSVAPVGFGRCSSALITRRVENRLGRYVLPPGLSTSVRRGRLALLGMAWLDSMLVRNWHFLSVGMGAGSRIESSVRGTSCVASSFAGLICWTIQAQVYCM